MRLNLREILHNPGGRIPFSFSMNLSDVDFHGEYLLPEPIQVRGEVENRAGVLSLRGNVSAVVHTMCDRCLAPLTLEKETELSALLAESLESEDEDEIILLDGGCVDVGELARTALILDMDTKYLCSEDCFGLCAQCGKNLNDGPCGCQKEVDPRFAKLQQWLEASERTEEVSSNGGSQE